MKRETETSEQRETRARTGRRAREEMSVCAWREDGPGVGKKETLQKCARSSPLIIPFIHLSFPRCTAVPPPLVCCSCPAPHYRSRTTGLQPAAADRK